MGIFRTQYGDLSAAEIQLLEAIRLKAVAAIQECREHQKHRCQCWAEARTRLYDLRVRTGQGSTLALAALGVWNTLEILARTREDRETAQAPQANISPQVAAEITGLPQPCKYNWRYYKAPEYTMHVN